MAKATRQRRAERARPAASVGEVRRWLRIPRALRLPGWVASKLAHPVSRELAARDGAPVDEAVFGIIDLETTGLSSERARILEIGLVVQRGGGVLETFESLVDVGAPVPSGITALTGIADDTLVDAPDEATALAGLADCIRRHDIDVMVAHNARFDRGFLERAWADHEMDPALPEFFCSVRVARKFVKSQRNDLDSLVDHLDIPRRARHRALGDAEMTSDLWAELVGRGKLRGVHTIEALARVGAIGRASRAGIRLVRNRSISQE